MSLEDVFADAIVGFLGFSCNDIATDGQIFTPTFNVTPVVCRAKYVAKLLAKAIVIVIIWG